MEIVSHLIEFIASFWSNLLPFHIVNAYEHGVILRFGRYKRDVEPGLVWKIPFFDNVMLCRNTMTTINLNSQALTTKDGHPVTTDAIVKYKIIDAQKFLLEVHEVEDAISDITQAKIKEIITRTNWEELHKDVHSDKEDEKSVDEKIKNLAHKEILKFGIKVYYITLTSLVKTRVYRLIQN